MGWSEDLRDERGHEAHAVGEDDGADEGDADGDHALRVGDGEDVAVAHGGDGHGGPVEGEAVAREVVGGRDLPPAVVCEPVCTSTSWT